MSAVSEGNRKCLSASSEMHRQILTLLFIGASASVVASSEQQEEKKHPNDKKLKDVTESGIAEAVKAGSKFFQYAHRPARDVNGFGHRPGSENYFARTQEKAIPSAGGTKTKVRWGDKLGGYGEYYWDLNHTGDDAGEEAQQTPHYVESPKYLGQFKPHPSRIPRHVNDAEFINEEAKQLYRAGKMQKHGGNYRKESEPTERAKRENQYFGDGFTYLPFGQEEGTERSV